MNDSALANLRHAYAQLANGGVKDSAQAKRLAGGLISPAIKALESAQREVAQLQARVAELETAIARIETEALADDGVLAESALFESIMDARNA